MEINADYQSKLKTELEGVVKQKRKAIEEGKFEYAAELRDKERGVKEKLEITSAAETRHQAVRLWLLDLLDKWEKETEAPEGRGLPDDIVFELEEFIAK
jgi:hypothetical protein